MSNVYIDKRLDTSARLYCRMNFRELMELLEFEQVRFHGRNTVWPASQALSAGLACGQAVQVPAVWRERLLPSRGQADLDGAQALIGMQRWFLGGEANAAATSADAVPESTVIVQSTVSAITEAALGAEGVRLVIAPVRYAAPTLMRNGARRLPDLLTGPAQRRRDREARVVAIQETTAPDVPGATEGAIEPTAARVRRALTFDLRTLIQGVAVLRDAPAHFHDLVSRVVQTRLWVGVGRL
ncbi:MAG: hypothetical protein REJ50_08930 [Bordetella sp.]|nr:hypothetical protein [Bordetella sp.]